MAYRLGIDVGGTFTDFVLLNDDTGQILTEKVLTTPADPWLGMQSGLRAFTARGIGLDEINTVIHGTTLVTNALIERRGAKVGLITTWGFRDILYFGREFRYDIYDPDLVLPEPLIPRHLRCQVHERVLGDGTVHELLNEPEARTIAQFLVGEGVEAFAVCLLHSYLQPKHELELREILAQVAPGLPVSLSHEVLPQIREYERCSATAVNAYAQPLMRNYLRRLRDGLVKEGCQGDLYLMTSSGGTISVETAEAFPIQLVESGPAAGTLIASVIGSQLASSNILSFDMGGTTAKSCVIRGGKPLVSKTYEVARVHRFTKGSGLPLGVPVIDLLEIGAGGGSIAEIDSLGLLRVGPRSAGADPGPVCYGRGGTEPTVTDANVVLGFIDPDYFLGGAMRLDRDAAARVLEEKIGRPLGLDAVHAAAAIHRVVNENMAEAAQVHSVEVNVDVRGFDMIAFGGAGPIHAYGVAARLRQHRIICPREAGVLSALGLLTAPLAFEFARSLTSDLNDLRAETVNAILAQLEADGQQLLRSAGVREVNVERSVDMCYLGQRFEVTTPIPYATLTQSAIPQLKTLFDQAYEKAYGRSLTELPARCVTWRVLSSGPSPKVALQSNHRKPSGTRLDPQHRKVVFPDLQSVECRIYRGDQLEPGISFDGPALIEEIASTIVVPPTAHVEIDEWDNVIIRLPPQN